MPGSTGPDLNTYSLPEVELGDTFNYWRDTTNTVVYKLNKLKVYDAIDSASIGATYSTSGVWTALILPTVTTGHTFSGVLVASGGLCASTLYVSGGATIAGSGLRVIGGISASGGFTLNGAASIANGLTVGGASYFSKGLTASTLDVIGESRFAGTIRLAANAIIAGNITLGDAATDDITANAKFNGITVSGGITVGGIAYFSGGVTAASTLNVTGQARFNTTTASTSSTTGSAIVVGGLGVAKDVFIGGSLGVANSLFVGVINTLAESGVALDVFGSTHIKAPYLVGITNASSGGNAPNLYRDVLNISSGSNFITGSLVLVLPKAGWPNTFLRIHIKGFDLSATRGGWDAIISGYPTTNSNTWSNPTQELRGMLPFSGVRLGYHDVENKVCIVLGNDSTTWQYPKIYVESVLASHSNTTGWGAGWTGYFDAALGLSGVSAGSLKQCLPRGYTQLPSGNFGIGTTLPAFGLDVVGSGRFTGGLTASTLDVQTTSRFAGTITLTTDAVIQGDITLGNAATDNITANAKFNGITIAGGLTVGGASYFSGGVTAASTLNVTGQAKFNATTASTSSITGSAIVVGGLGVAKNVIIGASLAVQSTTDTTSPTTGGLIVVGGVGISAGIRVGATASFYSHVVVGATATTIPINSVVSTATGKLSVFGDVEIVKGFFINREIVIDVPTIIPAGIGAHCVGEVGFTLGGSLTIGSTTAQFPTFGGTLVIL